MNTQQPTPDEVRVEIKRLVADVTETEPEEISDTASFAFDLDLDSLMALEVMVSLSKKYRIEIPEEEFAPLENVNDAVDLVMEYINKSKAVDHAHTS